MQFLSEGWLAALDAAARATPVGPGTEITIEQTVHGHGPDVVWRTQVTDGSMRVIPGSSPEADVRFSCDTDTAEAVAAGTLSAQRAFLDGRLRLTGEVRRLMDARSALDALAEVYASVPTTIARSS